MSMTNAILQEFDREAATTRRVLERVPTDKLAWQPHAKSMTLGGLALHTAMVPGHICGWAKVDEFVFTGDKPPVANSTAEILAAHDASVKEAKEIISGLGDEGLAANWKASAGGKALFEMPKSALLSATSPSTTGITTAVSSSVYLRLLDVPVPSIYGPSADENPFQ